MWDMFVISDTRGRVKRIINLRLVWATEEHFVLKTRYVKLLTNTKAISFLSLLG